MNAVTVLIYDSLDCFKSGFYDELAERPEITIVGKTYTAERCVDFAISRKPELILFDVNTEPDSCNAVEILKRELPQAKILIFSEYIRDVHIFHAFADGADNYCPKSSSVPVICKTILGVVDETLSVNSMIAHKLINRTREVSRNQLSLLFIYNKLSHLSKGEFALLRELYDGASYNEIAERKCIEVESVKKMARRLLKRMDAANIKELLDTLHDLQIFEFIEKGNLEF